MPHRAYLRHPWFNRAVGAAAGLVLGVGLVTGVQKLNYNEQQPTAEEQMYNCLRPLPQEEALRAIYGTGEFETPARQQVYEAICDVRTVAELKPMFITFPPGIKWKGGQLGNIHLVRPPVGTAFNRPMYYDPLCELGLRLYMDIGATCTDPDLRKPGSRDEMMKSLVKVTTQNAGELLKGLIDPSRRLSDEEVRNWYVVQGAATLHLAPLFGADALTIWLPERQPAYGQLGESVIRTQRGEIANNFCRTTDFDASLAAEFAPCRFIV